MFFFLPATIQVFIASFMNIMFKNKTMYSLTSRFLVQVESVSLPSPAILSMENCLGPYVQGH